MIRDSNKEQLDFNDPNQRSLLGAIAAGQIKYRVWEPGDIAVRLYGPAAVIRYRARLEVIFNGHLVPPAEYWHTDVYERRGGRWMVVWSQATAIGS